MKFAARWGVVALCLGNLQSITPSQCLWAGTEQPRTEPSMADREAESRRTVEAARDLPPWSISKVQARLQLSAALREQQKFSEAEAIYRKTLADCRASYGDESPTTAAVESGLGVLLHQLGRYSEAERVLRHSLGVYGQTVTEHPSQFGVVLGLLGSLYLDERRYGQAEPVLEKARSVLQSSGGTAVQIADVLNDLAILKQKTGKLSEADELFARSIAILESEVDRDAPQLAQIRKNRATALSALRRYAEAEMLCRQSLASLERMFGSDSPRVAVVLTQYAGLLQRMHRRAEAKKMNLRSERITSTTRDSRSSALTVDVGALQAASPRHSGH